MQFIYPANLSVAAPDEVVVSFRDLPECLTSGADTEDALSAAADALEEALAGRIDDGEPIPTPSVAEPGDYSVAVPPGMAAKAALAIAFRESGLTGVAFAAVLGIDEESGPPHARPASWHVTGSYRQGAPVPGAAHSHRSARGLSGREPDTTAKVEWSPTIACLRAGPAPETTTPVIAYETILL